MTNNLEKDCVNLKQKLDSIRSELENKCCLMKQRQLKWDAVKGKVDELLLLSSVSNDTANGVSKTEEEENKVIVFNLNGSKSINNNKKKKKYATKMKTLTKDKNTLFYKLLQFKKMEGEEVSEICLQGRNEKYFSIVLNCLRNPNSLNLKALSEQEQKELKEEALYFEVDYIINKLGGRPKVNTQPNNNNDRNNDNEFKIINMICSGEYTYNNNNNSNEKTKIATNKLEDLLDKDNLSKGVVVNENGYIIFELQTPLKQTIQQIQVAGFKYDNNSSNSNSNNNDNNDNNTIWNARNGIGAKIQVSEDGKDYITVGEISKTNSNNNDDDNNDNSFESGIITIDLKHENIKQCKYIKISGVPLLGLGYFNILK